MRCAECAEARRFNQTGIYCAWYGIIMSETHECSLPGAKRKAADGGTSATGPSEEQTKGDHNNEL